jgi:hypothetical protein
MVDILLLLLLMLFFLKEYRQIKTASGQHLTPTKEKQGIGDNG